MPKLTGSVFFFVLFVMASFSGYSQYDTVRSGSYFRNDILSYRKYENNHSGWGEIDGRAFPVPANMFVNILRSLFYVRELSKGWDVHANTLTIDSALELRHCAFYRGVSGSRPSAELYLDARYAIPNGLFIDSMRMPTGAFAYFKSLISRSDLELVSSKLDYFMTSGCEGGLRLTNNDLVWAMLSSGRYDRDVDFFNNRFLAPNPSFSSARDHYSSAFHFEGNEYDSLTMSFEADSIGSDVQINNYRNDYDSNVVHDRFSLILKNCYVNGPMVVYGNGKEAIIRFDHCSFGPAADFDFAKEQRYLLAEILEYPFR
jgi:hypothetical protein